MPEQTECEKKKNQKKSEWKKTVEKEIRLLEKKEKKRICGKTT